MPEMLGTWSCGLEETEEEKRKEHQRTKFIGSPSTWLHPPALHVFRPSCQPTNMARPLPPSPPGGGRADVVL